MNLSYRGINSLEFIEGRLGGRARDLYIEAKVREQQRVDRIKQFDFTVQAQFSVYAETQEEAEREFRAKLKATMWRITPWGKEDDLDGLPEGMIQLRWYVVTRIMHNWTGIEGARRWMRDILTSRRWPDRPVSPYRR
jgi:hypothetical protein